MSEKGVDNKSRKNEGRGSKEGKKREEVKTEVKVSEKLILEKDDLIPGLQIIHNSREKAWDLSNISMEIDKVDADVEVVGKVSVELETESTEEENQDLEELLRIEKMKQVIQEQKKESEELEENKEEMDVDQEEENGDPSLLELILENQNEIKEFDNAIKVILNDRADAKTNITRCRAEIQDEK